MSTIDNAKQLVESGLQFHISENLLEAIEFYSKALSIEPNLFDALHLSGVAHIQSGQIQRGVELLSTAVRVNNSSAAAFNNLGNAYNQLGQLIQAIHYYDRAISIKNDYHEAYFNRAMSLRGLGRLDDALACFDKAIHFKPDYIAAHISRGNLLAMLNRHKDAIAAYDLVLRIDPSNAASLYNRGTTLRNINRISEAADSYRKLLDIAPHYECVLGQYIHLKLQQGEWDDLPSLMERLSLSIKQGFLTTSPFPVLGLLDDPEIHLLVAENFAKKRHPVIEKYNSQRTGTRTNICIGYYSSDFYNHATAYLIAELLEVHNREDFEIVCFSYGPNVNDDMQRRISASASRFLDVGMKSDKQVAELSREYGVDIAVDLKGYTKDGRVGIFANRCAPIQVSYLGYPGSMGTEFHDYFIADNVVVPDESKVYYSEKVVILPGCYQVNDSRRRISDAPLTRYDYALPERGFVFCCLNNSYKILPTMFDSWSRILAAVPQSVLWLIEDSDQAVENFRREALRRGVDSDRLVFAKRTSLDLHLARHRLADLFLDTLPYGAHTTASDALWAGLPVLTQLGRAFAGRVAGSLLATLELPELITTDRVEYEARAIELALNPDVLEAIKVRLKANASSSTLFNARTFAMNLEAAYREMMRRYDAGLSPSDIWVGSRKRAV